MLGRRAALPAWELRRDPTDPRSTKMYTQEQFVSFYGPQWGPKAWAAAERRPDPKVRPPRKGVWKKTYTRRQFDTLYGPDAKKMWIEAGEPKTTKKDPVMGDIEICQYTKRAVRAVKDTRKLYPVQDMTCGESTVDCACVQYAKAAEPSLQDGTCAAQGYDVDLAAGMRGRSGSTATGSTHGLSEAESDGDGDAVNCDVPPRGDGSSDLVEPPPQARHVTVPPRPWVRRRTVKSACNFVCLLVILACLTFLLKIAQRLQDIGDHV